MNLTRGNWITILALLVLSAGIGYIAFSDLDSRQGAQSESAAPDSAKVAEVKQKLKPGTLIVWKNDKVTRVSVFNRPVDKVEHRTVNGVIELTSPEFIAKEAKLVLEKPNQSSDPNDDIRYETAATAWTADLGFNEAFSRVN